MLCCLLGRLNRTTATGARVACEAMTRMNLPCEAGGAGPRRRLLARACAPPPLARCRPCSWPHHCPAARTLWSPQDVSSLKDFFETNLDLADPDALSGMVSPRSLHGMLRLRFRRPA